MRDDIVLLDSSAIIKHLNNEVDINAVIGQFSSPKRFVSVVTFIESLAHPEMTWEQEQRTRAFLEQYIIIEITPEIREEAIHIRRSRLLKLPDALIAATAVQLGGVLLSSDKHLTRFSWEGFSVRTIA
jgi:predicted nucleic acid-binding protein